MRGVFKMADKISDQWQTPQWLFDELNQEFNFDIDLCATVENRKCEGFYSDYLDDMYMQPFIIGDLRGHNEKFTPLSMITKGDSDHLPYSSLTCFMNPPYSNPRPFIEKAWEDSKYCKIVCLVKCDPSTKWWSTFWDYGKEINCSLCRGTGFTNLAYLGIPKIYCTQCGGTKKEIYSGSKPGCDVRFFSKRIKFEHPSLDGKSGPTFPCALIIMDRGGL